MPQSCGHKVFSILAHGAHAVLVNVGCDVWEELSRLTHDASNRIHRIVRLSQNRVLGFQRILKNWRLSHLLGLNIHSVDDFLELVLANTFETIILHDENSHYSTIMTIGISINN